MDRASSVDPFFEVAEACPKPKAGVLANPKAGAGKAASPAQSVPCCSSRKLGSARPEDNAHVRLDAILELQMPLGDPRLLG